MIDWLGLCSAALGTKPLGFCDLVLYQYYTLSFLSGIQNIGKSRNSWIQGECCKAQCIQDAVLA